MTNEIQQHLNQITKKNRIKYLDISNRDLTGKADLSEFTALTSLNSYNNKFENLEFLNSLPNKETLKKINFFGNQLKEIDFAWLLSTFPNLEAINIENNPVKTKNLTNLTAEQFSRLVAGIKNKKFRIVSWQGTILMDLLEYAKDLVAKGQTNTQTQAHTAYLQTLVQENPQPKEIKTTTPKDSQINAKNPNTNTYLLIGGLILLITSVLAIGYWLGKRKWKPEKNDIEE
ncbi:MAG: hypothetical protein MRECE_2c070 [Mycoplasmataceae bacterium CE_OT135]|nr:MAG: hypothetical protein MRECE_2c070 [Mycoplasmataceae bacterium CE_OT135]